MSGIKMGEIDIGDQVIDNEYRIKVLSKILEWLLNNNANIQAPTRDQINELESESLTELQNKYPNSGIRINS